MGFWFYKKYKNKYFYFYFSKKIVAVCISAFLLASSILFIGLILNAHPGSELATEYVKNY
jgi:hypothetical protein